jgi:transposase InsO family protein
MAERVVPMDVRAAIVNWKDPAPRGAVSRFCEQHQISRSQFYEIRARAKAEGPIAAMAYRRRLAPPRHPQAVDVGIEDLAVAVRKDLAGQGLDHGPVTVRWHLQQLGVNAPAASTLARIFTSRGMVVPQPQKRPRSSYRRFEFAAVHECWQLDAFEWPLTDGGPESLTAHIYQVLDDCSRYLVATRVALSENSTDAVAVVEQAIASAQQAPCLFLSDNGSAFNQTRRGFTSKLVTHLEAYGTRCITGKPGHPQTQGKDERIHQTTQRWLRAHPVTNLEQLIASLADFDEIYNHQRPHQSLGMQTPAQALSHRPLAIPPLPPEPGNDTTRANPQAVTARTYRIDANGLLAIRRHWVCLGREHARITVTVVASGHSLAIFNDHGTLLRSVVLIPGKRYYGNGKKSPGRPKKNTNRPD